MKLFMYWDRLAEYCIIYNSEFVRSMEVLGGGDEAVPLLFQFMILFLFAEAHSKHFGQSYIDHRLRHFFKTWK